MGKLNEEAVLVDIIAIEPIRFNGRVHPTGARVKGLTQQQSDELEAMGHARPATDEDDAIEEAGSAVGSPAAPGPDANAAGAGTLISPPVAAAVAEAKASKPATKTAPAKTAARKTARA
ncbi:hypothetical protein [Polaromonas sp. UC242_47]|uniref:hypothetical protein n=1 Tax=Polaromonas sp. UC242_47 TaxID=3374626 RepID=UPI0037A82C0E